VLKVLRVWSDSCIYPQEKLKLWYDTFTDLSQPPPVVADSESIVPTGPVAFKPKEEKEEIKKDVAEDDLDGEPLGDDDLDGVPYEDELDGEPVSDTEITKSKWDEDDIDGVPIEEKV
jgi:hypothetical protein